MGNKQSKAKVTDAQRREFILKNWQLFKDAIPVSVYAKNQHVVKLAELLRIEFGYSKNTWNSDLLRPFIPYFFAIVDEKMIVTHSLN